MKLPDLLSELLAQEQAVTAIEYGLIAALVAVVLIAGATALGANINAVYTMVAGVLSAAMAG